jgi:glucose-1-phosphate cytidylyltransferase
VNVGQRFGVIEMDDSDTIKAFREKSDSDGSVINGGFMVFQPEIFQYIDDDTTVFERKPLESMAKLGQLKAYKHDGFWHCMDTQRDKMHLEELWATNKAPWKIWNI